MQFNNFATFYLLYIVTIKVMIAASFKRIKDDYTMTESSLFNINRKLSMIYQYEFSGYLLAVESKHISFDLAF